MAALLGHLCDAIRARRAAPTVRELEVRLGACDERHWRALLDVFARDAERFDTIAPLECSTTTRFAADASLRRIMILPFALSTVHNSTINGAQNVNITNANASHAKAFEASTHTTHIHALMSRRKRVTYERKRECGVVDIDVRARGAWYETVRVALSEETPVRVGALPSAVTMVVREERRRRRVEVRSSALAPAWRIDMTESTLVSSLLAYNINAKDNNATQMTYEIELELVDNAPPCPQCSITQQQRCAIDTNNANNIDLIAFEIAAAAFNALKDTYAFNDLKTTSASNVFETTAAFSVLEAITTAFELIIIVNALDVVNALEVANVLDFVVIVRPI